MDSYQEDIEEGDTEDEEGKGKGKEERGREDEAAEAEFGAMPNSGNN